MLTSTCLMNTVPTGSKFSLFRFVSEVKARASCLLHGELPGREEVSSCQRAYRHAAASGTACAAGRHVIVYLVIKTG